MAVKRPVFSWFEKDGKGMETSRSDEKIHTRA